jgi:hypothetical protein
MMKRSGFLIAALGLLASSAFVTPSQAGMVTVQVSDSFSATNVAIADTISSITLTFTGLNGLTDLTMTGNGITNTPAIVTPTTTTTSTSVTLHYSPSVFTASASITFDTLVPSGEVSNLSSDIKVTGTYVTVNGTTTLVVPPPSFSVAAVPEPSSMALLGIGMTSFLAFRRLFKRGTPIA